MSVASAAPSTCAFRRASEARRISQWSMRSATVAGGSGLTGNGGSLLSAIRIDHLTSYEPPSGIFANASSASDNCMTRPRSTPKNARLPSRFPYSRCFITVTPIVAGSHTTDFFTDPFAIVRVLPQSRERLGLSAERAEMIARLPQPGRLLAAIEHGVGSAYQGNFDREVENQLRITRAVRSAVQEECEPSDLTPETFRTLARKRAKGPPRLTPEVAAAAAEACAEEWRGGPRQSMAIKEAGARARQESAEKNRREPRTRS